MTDKIRIFIGTSANNEDADAEMVLEYSLRKNSSTPLEITFMRQTHDTESPWGGWRTENWSTPFSGFRWAIPEVCSFQGRAIYMDVDMINLSDITELYNIPMESHHLMAAREGIRFGGTEFCVIVFDCAKMKEHLIPVSRMKKIPEFHHRMISKFTRSETIKHFDPAWNNHDGDGKTLDKIKHLHYTEMSTQPWKPAWFTGVCRDHPRPDLVKLWFDTKKEALGAGYTPKLYNDTFGKYNIIGR